MFDKLDDILIRYEEIMQELNNPYVAEDQNRFRKLMKEQLSWLPLLKFIQNIKAKNKP